MLPTVGIAAYSASTPLRPWAFSRRDPRPRDVVVDILFCGICHSDLHTVRGEWSPVDYPLVPGHEIVGRVASHGRDVHGFTPGDLVAVGCFVDSCRTCGACASGLEQYCEDGVTGTYDSTDRVTGERTQGGYATRIVTDEHFVFRVPERLDPASVAPLLCAGITTWSPLREWSAGPGMDVGIVGLGGLGHMGIKLARALGATVTVITTSPEKRVDAERLGASRVIVSRDAAAMREAASSLDLILDTVSAPHDLGAELRMLRRDGTLVLLGGSPVPHPSPEVWPFITGRRRLAGSLVGGVPETQAMLDFCGAREIVSEVEVIRADDVNTAYERMLAGDVKYRFVIDCGTIGG